MSLLAAAVATADGKGKPPSTGKQLTIDTHLPSVREATATMTAALAEALKSKPDCEVVASPKVRVAWFLLPVPTKATLTRHARGYVGIARCAEQRRFYTFEKDVASQLVMAGMIHPELLARALIGLKDYKTAAALLVRAHQLAPKDPNVLLTAAKLECHASTWKPCIDDAGAALANIERVDGDERIEIAHRAFKYAARAALHLGAPDRAEEFVGQARKLGADPADIAEITAQITQARSTGVLVEADYDHELPLGIYHLYGKVQDAGPLLQLAITNVGAKDLQVVVEVGIDGVTQKTVQTLAVGRGQSQRQMFDPPLSPGFDVRRLRAAQDAQISVKVSAGGSAIYEQSLPLVLQPRDFLPTIAYDGADAEHRTSWFYGAWITPNARAVDAFLQRAKARAPSHTFAGEQTDTVPQVRAIYEELQAEGMSYVMDPDVLANDAIGQRTRLPSEVLKSTNAQCLEGALLYATLLEAIGLRPIVVRVPGHAFVGWRPSAKDPLRGKLHHDAYFLETTATHDASFEQAVDYAMDEFEQHDQKHEAAVIDIPELRRAGVTPQPTE
jgi:hypothetical protein